jgi:hypothetical protein
MQQQAVRPSIPTGSGKFRPALDLLLYLMQSQEIYQVMGEPCDEFHVFSVVLVLYY